ncbi:MULTISPECIES: M12 family metallopeptidase [unclassified Pseudomonas]|uniref:M12 family metallopeptidase n=1 Tax=Pseudomonas sp. A-R-26 TaxID=2832404 RepID=UPI001CC18005|nr:M12 family metallopeptidase [Pseudomonas sp. A-R-26]
MHTPHFVRMKKPLNEQDSRAAAVKENARNVASTLPGRHQKRSVGYHSTFWENGKNITISFMPGLRDEMKYDAERIIREWEPYVGLAFEVVESGGEIRIDMKGEDSWSTLGTDALLQPPDEPTLLIGIDAPYMVFRRTVLHEFGHALGLHHAHLHPQANIPWNREKVYEYYTNVIGWSREVIDHNIFDLETGADTFLGNYDKYSIMHYSVENSLTDGDWHVGRYTELSEQDKININNIYPLL